MSLRSPWEDDNAIRTAHVRLSSVTLDIGNAMELSELLDYLAQWLGIAGPAVGEDLKNCAWDQGAIGSVREHLVSFSRLLVFGHAPVEPDLDSDSDDGAGGPQW